MKLTQKENTGKMTQNKTKPENDIAASNFAANLQEKRDGGD